MADEDPEETETPDEASESEADAGRGSAWNWWLLVIPALALLDLIIVGLYGANVLSPADIADSVTLEHIVIGGSVILGILLIAEIVLLAGGHPEHLEDDEEPAPEPDRPAARGDTGVPEAQGGEASSDLEALATDDEVEGRKVLELARPPKAGIDTGVYSTTYVEVDNDRVLRVEELVARRAS